MNSKNLFYVIGILVLVGISGLAGFFLGKGMKQIDNVITPTASVTPTPIINENIVSWAEFKSLTEGNNSLKIISSSVDGVKAEANEILRYRYYLVCDPDSFCANSKNAAIKTDITDRYYQILVKYNPKNAEIFNTSDLRVPLESSTVYLEGYSILAVVEHDSLISIDLDTLSFKSIRKGVEQYYAGLSIIGDSYNQGETVYVFEVFESGVVCGEGNCDQYAKDARTAVCKGGAGYWLYIPKTEKLMQLEKALGC